MVESFKLKEDDAVRVDGVALQRSTTALFEKLGVPVDDAALAADVLVSADLRGVDSHGVSNMLEVYIDRYLDGTQNLTPQVRVVRERSSTATLDGDRGLGVIVVPKAMEMAVAKARETGVGVVTMSNAGHLGMAAYHAMLALPHDMVGMCMTATGPQVVPTFGREPRLGTNPIAFAAPAGEEQDFVFDMATSIVPINKVRNARRMGHPVPPGHIASPDGTPIMEETLAPEDFLVMPLGSTRELGSHKGYGLASVVEIMCSMLAGANFGNRLPRHAFRHFVVAYNIEAFTDVGEFKHTMDEFIRDLKSTPPAAGQERVMVAGQPEWEALADRKANGIPLHHEVVEWFRGMCAEHEVRCEI
jgi:LDH2 family malate/lactate/ureidoglycolate dehydrogenase